MIDPASDPARPAQPPRDLPRTAGVALRMFLSYWSPRILLIAASLALLARLATPGWNLVDLLILAALLLYWPINEWLIHTQILHYRPLRLFGRAIDFRLPQTHREHHADPWNLPRVFIPLHVFPLTFPLLLGAAWLLTPDLPRMLSFLAVYLLLALHYEWVHYLAHIGWCPPLAFYEQRVREHRLHHFRNDRYWWGVSMGSGDRLLRTAPKAEDVPRDLGMAVLAASRGAQSSNSRT